MTVRQYILLLQGLSIVGALAVLSVVGVESYAVYGASETQGRGSREYAQIQSLTVRSGELIVVADILRTEVSGVALVVERLVAQCRDDIVALEYSHLLEGAASIGELSARFEELVTAVTGLTEWTTDNRPSDQAVDLYDAASAAFRRSMDAVVMDAERQATAQTAELEHQRRRTVILAMSLAISYVLLMLWLQSWTTRRLAMPIRELADAAEAATHSGEGFRTVTPGGAREVRQLIDSFGSLTRNLERTVAERTRQLAGKNTDLEQAINDRTRYERLLDDQNQVLKSLLSRSGIHDVLNQLAEAVERYRPDIKVSILLSDGIGMRLRVGAAPSVPKEFIDAVDGIEIGPSIGSCGAAATLRERVIVEDITLDVLWRPFRKLVDLMNVGACWTEPIEGTDGNLLGTFTVFTREARRPEADELEMVESAAQLVAVILEHKRIEQAVWESRQRLRLIYDSAIDGILLIDPKREQIVEINPAASEMLGYRVEELVGAGVYKVYGEDLADFRDFTRRVMLDGKASSTELSCRDRNGQEIPVEISASRLDHNDKPLLLALVRNISERRRAEEDRVALQRMLVDTSREAGKAEIAAGVLHNVGNILNSVATASGVAAAQIAELRVDDLEQVAKLIESNRQSLAVFFADDARGQMLPEFLTHFAAHLTNVRREAIEELNSLQEHIDHIGGVVSVQQAHARNIRVIEAVTARQIVEAALNISMPGETRNHAIIRQKVPRNVSLHTDRNAVLDILVNLINNARQAVRHRETADRLIELTVERAEGRIVFTVKDNGVGIPPENMTRLFQHGFTTKKDGHGFGLHMASLTASALGGELLAASCGIDRGAEFRLILPEHFEKEAMEEAA